ncbi:hypothetical protein K461DRAFT_296201 [Myriangium duriaei CBS 260.36]|uniref:Uncharacterized protein n=1 Tax=Myriangium duriaei CBS 260.36 TaxID=1168546 RepID=A0A9P4IU96_9PEZI|nr:hypothetical protein K461DRAFT_296201 [Myriangium duriaei CBS 260.36]
MEELMLLPVFDKLTDNELSAAMSKKMVAPQFHTRTKNGVDQTMMPIEVDYNVLYSLDYAHAANTPFDDGLWDNPCWPKAQTPDDPGFAILALQSWLCNHGYGSVAQQASKGTI